MPSLYEGFGFPVLEAMACGTPVVCSRAASLPELAGDAGVVVDLGRGAPTELAEALRSVLSDSEFSATLRRKGLAQAAAFRWSETTRRTVDVYHRGTIELSRARQPLPDMAGDVNQPARRA